MLDTLYTQIGAAIWVLACVFAFWKGEWTEQCGAALYLLGWLASLFAQDDIVNPQLAVFGIDAVSLTVLAILSWKSERTWPLWASAFQAIQTAVHVAHALRVDISPHAFFTALNIATYGVLGSLTVGTFIAWREREALLWTSDDGSGPER